MNPNDENVTLFDENLPVTEDVQVQARDKLYTSLWKVQRILKNPRKLYTDSHRVHYKEFISTADACISKFAEVSHELNEHKRNPVKEKLITTTKREFFISKFLTNRELFDAQVRFVSTLLMSLN
jgi:hypothetical protein